MYKKSQKLKKNFFLRKMPNFNQRFKISFGNLKNKSRKIIKTDRPKQESKKKEETKIKVDIPTHILKKMNEEATFKFRNLMKKKKIKSYINIFAKSARSRFRKNNSQVRAEHMNPFRMTKNQKSKISLNLLS